VFTRQQLAAFGGARGAPMYLSILGDVFDVSSKPEFYGEGVPYSHFVGADGSRAFVTGAGRAVRRACCGGTHAG
jgi:predicted heme/steroid binding protein